MPLSGKFLEISGYLHRKVGRYVDARGHLRTCVGDLHLVRWVAYPSSVNSGQVVRGRA